VKAEAAAKLCNKPSDFEKKEGKKGFPNGTGEVPEQRSKGVI